MSDTSVEKLDRTTAELVAWLFFGVSLFLALLCSALRDDTGLVQVFMILFGILAVAGFIPAILLVGIRQLRNQERR